MCKIEIPQLLFYVYMPVLTASSILGLFIYFSNRKKDVNKKLALFILFFCLWVVITILTWVSSDLKVTLFLERIAIFGTLAIVFLLFFSYSLLEKELLLKSKVLLFLPFVPVLLFLFTDYNVYIVNANNCTIQSGIIQWYAYLLVFVYTLFLIRIFLHELKKSIDDKIKKQLKIVLSGIVFLIIWILLVVISRNVLVSFGQNSGDEAFLFMPVGMLIFIALLTYAITKYQLLKIKLIAAQALTYAIWILIGSQYFFADSMVVYLLITFTLLLSVLFGFMLVKSIRQEVQRKEELQLMADKLATANDALRKLDNAKTEFISIASHQLRTPITAIKGFTSLLLEGSYGELNEGVHGALEKMYGSSERLVNLIEDLLNVSRIESGRMQFSFEKAEVEKLIKELFENFILIAKDKKFYLDLKLPEKPLPEIVMDYDKIRELVSNFIDNALKYTEKGGVTVKAEEKEYGVVIDENGFVIPEKKSEFGKVVRITVSDTGIGIPKEEIPYLFKKFSRGKDVSRLHVGGTGLGLYVGKAIAEAHHGAVWVESDGAGHGSRFIIEIPVQHMV